VSLTQLIEIIYELRFKP